MWVIRVEFFMTPIRTDMSENELSHIDMVANSVGSDTCHYSWVVRVTTFKKNVTHKKLHIIHDT